MLPPLVNKWTKCLPRNSASHHVSFRFLPPLSWSTSILDLATFNALAWNTVSAGRQECWVIRLKQSQRNAFSPNRIHKADHSALPRASTSASGNRTSGYTGKFTTYTEKLQYTDNQKYKQHKLHLLVLQHVDILKVASCTNVWHNFRPVRHHLLDHKKSRW